MQLKFGLISELTGILMEFTPTLVLIGDECVQILAWLKY